MSKHIRQGFVAAMGAMVITATSAAAAAPAWFYGADRNQDGRVTWSEYSRNSAFDVLDENGDGLITPSEEFGGSAHKSSWALVAALDSDRSGAVTLHQFNRQLRVTFDAYDLDRDGALDTREAELARRAESGRTDGEGRRGFGDRDGLRAFRR